MATLMLQEAEHAEPDGGQVHGRAHHGLCPLRPARWREVQHALWQGCIDVLFQFRKSNQIS